MLKRLIKLLLLVENWALRRDHEHANHEEVVFHSEEPLFVPDLSTPDTAEDGQQHEEDLAFIRSVKYRQVQCVSVILFQSREEKSAGYHNQRDTLPVTRDSEHLGNRHAIQDSVERITTVVEDHA